MKALFFNILILCIALKIDAQSIALWTFDEPQGLYPSSVLSDHSDNDFPLVIGNGGIIVEGKFGNALYPELRPEIVIPEGAVQFGLKKLSVPDGRTTIPLSWHNANFCALMTSGEKHLRNQVGFPRVTNTKLNIGDFDWTIEFWLKPLEKTAKPGTIFEIGTGPRGENNKITKLELNKEQTGFILYNQPTGSKLEIISKLNFNHWNHVTFGYSKSNKSISHYINGKLVSKTNSVKIQSLDLGDEDYMSIGRDGNWNNPLQGVLDELRFSEGIIYTEDFKVPGSFSYLYSKTAAKQELKKGPELLFGKNSSSTLEIGNRKHLFIDDALLEQYDEGVKFVVNPPKPDKIVMTGIKGKFRKHLSVFEDEDGKIRLYTTVEDDYLAVWLSDDGENFYAPELPNGNYKGHTNIVLHANVGMGMVFIDPNAPKQEKYKYISDYHRRAVFLFYSEDGFEFKRVKQPVLPFRSGSQCNIYYDDQKQVYTAFHRSDFGRTTTNDTQRDFVMTETNDLLKPWEFKPLNKEDYKSRMKGKRVAELQPWYLDNGPLTPGGFSLEYPWIFSPDDNLDPRETDIYVPKAMKYPWAPDTYLAFPIIYFHYETSVPVTRLILWEKKREKGSGPVETQLAVSRNGENWKRFPRPAYVGIGEYQGIDFKQSYIAHGMVKHENEIWQYCFCEPHYHSPWKKFDEDRSVIKLNQRIDGFVSIDSPYEKEVYATTKPFIFDGDKLHLNVDTDAAGYVQVGFIDEDGNDIPGFSVDDCIYINGDFVDYEVEWMKNRQEIEKISNDNEELGETFSSEVKSSTAVSELKGKTVQLIFRMRGSKLYAMQFK